jgi:hypothetical protein
VKEITSMPMSDKDGLAAVVAQRWLDFQNALPGNKKYPVQQFKSFADATKRYIDISKGDAVIDRSVATAINGLKGISCDGRSSEKIVGGFGLW